MNHQNLPVSLDTQIIIKSKYKGKSKFDFWKELNVGDTVKLSIGLNPLGRGESGLYATQVELTNEITKLEFKDSINNICKYLSKVDYVELSNGEGRNASSTISHFSNWPLRPDQVFRGDDTHIDGTHEPNFFKDKKPNK